ncbi:helix-turn-helix domain-containing protein [Brachybacterium sp. JHP9]|uniref:Helix-turn-helix domain-containing protein n=1 Tax=Brachybacterium equifaecis TaxID=2910770 RepID=A0ABT0R1R6_9MICO|nr:helix-turn-helix domain-containing protein [Brachybacterium equifaecis]MCL6423871.1 helix-turn-helix domain-containing protein [Brachybacterium equifaecis]
MITASAYAPLTTDDRISASAKALMAARGIRTEELALAIGISRNPMFAKLRGSSAWKASEVAAMADYFGVGLDALFEGLGLLEHDEAPRSSDRGASHRVRHQGLEPRTR